MDSYQADPAPEPSLSSGVAHLLCSSSPAHAREAHPRLNPAHQDEEAERFDIGTAAHCILLEGVNRVQVLDFPDWRTNLAKAKRDEARANGRIPLLAKVWADVEAMVNATRDQLDAHQDGRHMFRDGQPEQVLIWQDIGGVWCRARTDWRRPGNIDDYKTTSATANPETLSRSLFSNGWDVQVAFYLRGLKALTGEDAVFRFAVQETYAPYALSVISLGPAALMLAEKKVLYALERWAECLRANSWPAYPLQTAYATLPEWEEARWLRREEAELVS